MHRFSVEIVQMSPPSASKEENLEKCLRAFDTVRPGSTDLVVFPEYQMLMPDFETRKG